MEENIHIIIKIKPLEEAAELLKTDDLYEMPPEKVCETAREFVLEQLEAGFITEEYANIWLRDHTPFAWRRFGISWVITRR